MSTFFWSPGIDLIVPTVTTSFLMHRDDSGLCQAHRVGVPEHALINNLKKHLDGTGILLDCGAHMGVYSILLSDCFEKVFAFEAQKRTYFQLCGNLFVNEITNVFPTHAGITASDKTHEHKTLYVVSEDGGGSSFVKPTNQKIISEEKVLMTAIDHKDYEGPVKLIKLDIEGYELDALRGAEMTIGKFKPVILFESNPGAEEQRNEIFNFLKKFNYQVGRVEQFENMFIAVAD
jgi:FkbM family methyltransferase|tara:strand:- start:26079 stop:26777 length:699 start_codon:yes stop_codon:yes gene_type:complete